MNAMLGTVRSRDLRNDIRLEFVQIQVTPLPLAMLVNRTWLPTRRAEHRAVMHDEGLDDFRSAIDVHVRHAPRTTPRPPRRTAYAHSNLGRAITMHVVVPVEIWRKERLAIGERAKAFGKRRVVLQRLKARFDEGVVVAYPRAAV